MTVTTASGADLEGSGGGAEVVAGAGGTEVLARAVEVGNVMGMMVADSSWRRTPGMEVVVAAAGAAKTGVVLGEGVVTTAAGVEVAVDEAAGSTAEVAVVSIEVPREGLLKFDKKKEAM